MVKLGVGGKEVEVKCLLSPSLVNDFGVIMGMDAITQLGGMVIDGNGQVRVGNNGRIVSIGVVDGVEINDKDFDAKFDGQRWMVKWKWINQEPPVIKSQNRRCIVRSEHQAVFRSELDNWIKNGWLEKYQHSMHGEIGAVIPLIAAEQPNKLVKVRPVMDYRRLNEHIQSNPGMDVAVCQEKLRSWRRKLGRSCLLDLKKAYLQVHIEPSLRKYQIVDIDGEHFVMTRMGFGLNVAPKIMTKIISRVLSLDEVIAKGTDHYIDDILVNEEEVSVEHVKRHLEKYGLITKEPEPIVNARVLGLRVKTAGDNKLRWSRDGDIPELDKDMTKRELFSLCGKMIGHYPVAGWLRVACSYVKRLANEVDWDKKISDSNQRIVGDMIDMVNRDDPVRGRWNIQSVERCKVWCDASSMAIGVSVEVDGDIIEDAAWMRKVDDGAHINVAELEAVIKGVSLALKWGVTKLEVITDSASVYGWVNSMLEDSRRPKVNGISEMIIRRRLSTIGQLVEEYQLEMTIRQVPSEQNKADALTRVPRKWLEVQRRVGMSMVLTDQLKTRVQELHQKHHFGVMRTHYLAEKLSQASIPMKMVENIVKDCLVCKSIDPSPVRWDKGTVEVQGTWMRLAADITHLSGRPYLTLIDCGPSRYTVWQALSHETAEEVTKHLNRVFLERGPPCEFLSDNGPCFRACGMKDFLQKWGIKQLFSCAYRPTGNGIIERIHRTIKRMVARSGAAVEEMVYWYNNSPNSHGVVPAETLFNYDVVLPKQQLLFDVIQEDQPLKSCHQYGVGDTVFVKPPHARCDVTWRKGVVTAVKPTSVEVDGVNRHIADIRLAESYAAQSHDDDDERWDTWNGLELESDAEDMIGTGGETDTNEADEDGMASQQLDAENDVTTVRERRPPRWMADYVL